MVETARPRKLTVWRTNHELPLWLRRLKVAAYCRVSSKHDEQLGSLENQAAYYESLIANNPHWELVEIFTDQRTARTMRRRTGLQRMLGFCHAHQIDLIITKSIKRFSRNTVDFLEVCNELKTLGVEVYFELENLYLSNPTSMLLLTIFASLAQAESENLSADICWGIRRGFEDGSSGFIDRLCYGYRKSTNGTLVVHEPEAKVVRLIYQWRIHGYTLRKISKLLSEKGITAPKGGKHWGIETLNKLLHNEKYTGNVMLQKTYVPNTLTGEQEQNNGQMPKYYVEHTHQEIITKEIFKKANEVSHCSE